LSEPIRNLRPQSIHEQEIWHRICVPSVPRPWIFEIGSYTSDLRAKDHRRAGVFARNIRRRQRTNSGSYRDSSSTQSHRVEDDRTARQWSSKIYALLLCDALQFHKKT
jgi:hypothetical protein